MSQALAMVGPFVLVVLLWAACVCLGAAFIELLWWLCDMGAWTKLGDLPWPAAFFLAIVLSRGPSTSKSKE